LMRQVVGHSLIEIQVSFDRTLAVRSRDDLSVFRS
jgi:hypothetical protein